jgi:hypothetical protein
MRYSSIDDVNVHDIFKRAYYWYRTRHTGEFIIRLQLIPSQKDKTINLVKPDQFDVDDKINIKLLDIKNDPLSWHKVKKIKKTKRILKNVKTKKMLLVDFKNDEILSDNIYDVLDELTNTTYELSPETYPECEITLAKPEHTNNFIAINNIKPLAVNGVTSFKTIIYISEEYIPLTNNSIQDVLEGATSLLDIKDKTIKSLNESNNELRSLLKLAVSELKEARSIISDVSKSIEIRENLLNNKSNTPIINELKIKYESYDSEIDSISPTDQNENYEYSSD